MPDADVRQLKAILAAEIIKTLDKNGLTVRKAQSLTGIDAGDFSRVCNADFRRISVERLMAMINRLGSRVDVAVKLRRVRVRQAVVARATKSGYEHVATDAPWALRWTAGQDENCLVQQNPGRGGDPVSTIISTCVSGVKDEFLSFPLAIYM